MPFSSPWWLLALALVGVLALVTILLTMFSALGDRPETVSITEVDPVDSEAFLLGVSGVINAPLQRGGSAHLLNNGDEFLPALLEALRSARRSVNFMVYIWEPGEMSDRVFEALVERARQGVEVRVMVDALGGHGAPEEGIEALRRAGGRWEWFHPLRFGRFTQVHRRNHRRAIVVDGIVGFTGGMAVADKWLGHASDPERWRDSMVEVRGCIASNLQSAFAQLWSHTTGEMLSGSRFFPSEEQAAAAAGAEGEAISRHVNVISSPSNEAHPLRAFFWFSFRSALRSLYVTNPYFVPDDLMCEVLQERARAGVDVRVLVPNEHIDVRLIRWASHARYEKLLAAGIRIFEFQPTMIHQKHAVIDGLWSLVGSANLDVRSKELNQENVLGIQDRGFARQMEEAFFADLARADEILLDPWRRRPLWRRVPERIASLFEEQF